MRKKLLWYNIRYYLTILINPALVFFIYGMIVVKTRFVGISGVIFTFSVAFLVLVYFCDQLRKLEEEWEILKRERKRERKRKERERKNKGS